MSSSNILSHFCWAEEAHPIGSNEFVVEFQHRKEEMSAEGQELRRLEAKQREEVQQAFQNGFAQGQAAGLQQGQNEIVRIQAQVSAAVTALFGYRRQIYEQARTQLLELAFAIANKITGTRATAEQETVMESINRCVAEILDKTRIKIKVNPVQYDFVHQRLDELTKSNDSIAAAVVEPDARVGVGGCIIETDSGSADARIESQLRLLHDKLLALEE